jgi:2-polyprenyl-3-methyl-5-hydroxy-6-metoxy-1,4-benzoquinol methylase
MRRETDAIKRKRLQGERNLMGTASRADRNRHRAAAKTLEGISGSKALDIGSGGGDFARIVARMGNHVTTCDFAVPALDPSLDSAEKLPFVRLDLGQPLPFRESSFDLLTALEVIEHIADPYRFINELRRVLKPGGTLLLSLPNKLQVRSRVRFLFSGLYKGLKLPLEPYKPAPRQHVMVLSYIELRYFLERAGFKIERLYRSRFKAVSLLYLALLGIPIVIYTGILLGLNPQVRDKQRRAYNRSVMRGILSIPALLSEDILLTARADGPSG